MTTGTPLVMGIINATHDSFYKSDLEGGALNIFALAKKMITEGADILDIGGMSTKPGSKAVSPDEEASRVIPVIRMIADHFPGIPVSVDTYRADIAEAAVHAGASIINDITGGEGDAGMLTTVAKLKAVYVCMHIKAMPENMQDHADYEDVTKEVLDYFIKKTAACKAAGIKDVIIDPGFGFAKNAAHNFKLLKELSVFKMLEKPILAGLSRKRTVYGTLGSSPAEALNGTTVLNTLALNNGANILRVHDVKEAKEAITLFTGYKNA